MNHIDLGRQGEEIAVKFLIKTGYKILDRDYKTKLGQIDIVGKEKNTICFIEVKTRSSFNKGLPAEAINIKKQKKLSVLALAYLKAKSLLDKTSARFDIISIILSPENNQEDIALIRNAFPLDPRFLY